jgi:hypothetical protein
MYYFDAFGFFLSKSFCIPVVNCLCVALLGPSARQDSITHAGAILGEMVTFGLFRFSNT